MTAASEILHVRPLQECVDVRHGPLCCCVSCKADCVLRASACHLPSCVVSCSQCSSLPLRWLLLPISQSPALQRVHFVAWVWCVTQPSARAAAPPRLDISKSPISSGGVHPPLVDGMEDDFITPRYCVCCGGVTLGILSCRAAPIRNCEASDHAYTRGNSAAVSSQRLVVTPPVVLPH